MWSKEKVILGARDATPVVVVPEKPNRDLIGPGGIRIAVTRLRFELEFDLPDRTSVTDFISKIRLKCAI